MDKRIKDLMSFLDMANCRFTASAQIESRLLSAGFTQVSELNKFDLTRGGRYYIRRMDTAIVAFVVGTKPINKTGFNIAASHIDSPSLKIKLDSVNTSKDVTRVGIEVYGSPILHTWLDRELSISGKVLVKTANGVSMKLLDLQKPIAIIPNAAIHLNRDINSGFEYNKQNHLQAILCVREKSSNPLRTYIAKHLKISEKDILAEELYLYDPAPAALVGLDQEIITCGRLDNLAMTHSILTALINSEKSEHTAMAVFFDHEEIGSQTPQGAFSSLLGEILERVVLSQTVSKEDYYIALRNSMLVSADMAHAFHPSYAEKYDPDYSLKMNQGITIKMNANHRYASTSESILRFTRLCEATKVPFQSFVMRSDLPCGSTVGPIVASNLGLLTVDIGNPMWAMHSIRESAGVLDHLSLIKVLELFFSE